MAFIMKGAFPGATLAKIAIARLCPVGHLFGAMMTIAKSVFPKEKEDGVMDMRDSTATANLAWFAEVACVRSRAKKTMSARLTAIAIMLT